MGNVDEYCQHTIRKAIKVFTVNIAIVVIGIVLYNNDTSVYSGVMFEETSEWERFPIKEVLDVPKSNETGCPIGYEMERVSFLGTRTLCAKNLGSYYVGKCSKTSGGTTIIGFPRTEMLTFNNQFICVRRELSKNYHQMVESRGLSNCSLTCGSNTIADINFCTNNITNCPINFLNFTSRNSSTNLPEPFSNSTLEVKTFAQNWTLQTEFANSDYGPLVNLYIGASRPCGIFSQSYQDRQVAVPLAYQVDNKQCKYDLDNNQQHLLFNPTGFTQKEFELYSSNGILDGIKVKVPLYKDEDLMKNNFTLYQKSYSLWSIQCQAKYSTRYVAEQAQKFDAVQYKFYVKFALSVTLYVVAFCFLAISIFITGFKQWLKIGHGLFSFFAEIGLYIALIVIYGSTMIDYNIVDVDVLQYYVDNDCSSGPLQSSFEILLQDMKRDYQILQTGLAFVIIALIFHIFSGIWAAKFELKHMIFCCCDKKQNNVVFELVKESRVLPLERNHKVGIARARHLANKPQKESLSQNSDNINFDIRDTMEKNLKDTSKASKHPYTQIADETQQFDKLKIDV